MLYTVNIGRTGLQPGCQRDVIHLVSTVDAAVAIGSAWAISDGNAGAYHASFSSQLGALSALDWQAIDADQWQGKTHEKSAEFLVADYFPWSRILHIGCQNPGIANQAQQLIANEAHKPNTTVQPNWYY
jgi:hypothetical protein